MKTVIPDDYLLALDHAFERNCHDRAVAWDKLVWIKDELEQYEPTPAILGLLARVRGQGV
jgi:hypothetical protein